MKFWQKLNEIISAVTRASQSGACMPEGACPWNVLKLHPPILVTRTVLFWKGGLWTVWNIIQKRNYSKYERKALSVNNTKGKIKTK